MNSILQRQKQNYEDKIHYDEYLEYSDVIRIVKKSKCILEIMQGNSISPTSRFAEALIYNRLLITDCRIDKFENIPNIVYFDEPESINLKRITKWSNADNKKWIDYFSIETMIRRLEDIEQQKK